MRSGRKVGDGSREELTSLCLFLRCQNRGGFRILPGSGLSLERSTLPSKDREGLAAKCTKDTPPPTHTHQSQVITVP